MTPNYWSTVSPTSSGNLYIVDFFGFPPGLGQGAAARLSIQSTVYWRVEVIKLRLLVRLCTLFPHCHPTSQRHTASCSGVIVAAPDAGLAPGDVSFVAVLVCACELCLCADPTFCKMGSTQSPLYVVKNRVISVVVDVVYVE